MAYKIVESYIEVEVDLDEWNDDELAEELSDRGYFVSKEVSRESFNMEDWKLLLEIVDNTPETVYTRRVREKLMNQRWG